MTTSFHIFVEGPLRNPMNGSYGHWSKHARWARDWRERTHLSWLAKYQRQSPPLATSPKLVTFRAHVWRLWDDDNLPPGLKPCRDALRDIGVIHDDSPASGHAFAYSQVIDHERRGVEITVEPLTARPA